ncbi:unnamed protein product [Tilletia laevis]|uniref:Major facilitator superfamily (MFS) profile domain-containing protein n=2 Tax=Tilletia TaxID=13289 RepID=A0A177VAJ1_9BASI|nr:hypothetical protein CF336_g7372 [Tilletia laevis]KAE8248550.1 hypothetical protein A4X03_0g6753 [Tilletia caries]KAE8188877.1 hypothetical protein CF335_g6770 [Tilletia laevis]CAD6890796.1 unnamed protein product [Tilletia caries]CAD6901546.1 unnamed protein product [Tilletia caries]
MPFGADMDAYPGDGSNGLSLVERQQKTYLGLSLGEVKLLSIAGVGYLLDAYDLFVINLISLIVPYVYGDLIRGGPQRDALNWGLNGGVFKASANIGNVLGQILFGFLGDKLGRTGVYGKELILVIVAVILAISAPDYLGRGVTYWITAFRILMGVGIGGDYPMSATIVADRASIKKRGILLALIFSNQGWGNLAAAIAGIAVIGAYKGPIQAGDLHKLSGAWRILQGIVLVPSFGVLYFRLTMVEASRFKQARALQDNPELLNENDTEKGLKKGSAGPGSDSDTDNAHGVENREDELEKRVKHVPETKAAKRHEFYQYFSQPRHAATLFGTAFTWFLVDITFYGINLNQSSILSSIGFSAASTDVYDTLFKNSLGGLIVTLAGFLPGYYITVALVEVIGRKPIQLLGFFFNAVFLGILAGKYETLKNETGPFFVVFVFLQLFFNFGANATTFIIPAEVFPTRVRGTAHGISAASGKCGAILASLLFPHLSKTSFGYSGVFWVMFGISVFAFFITLFFTRETMGLDPDEEDRQELANPDKSATFNTSLKGFYRDGPFQ